MSSLPALYIGRFQPFHLGHLDAIQQILATHTNIIIAIGSAEQSFQPQNPFTAAERIQLIDTALQEAQISRDRYQIIPVRNINNYALWTAHVEQYCPPFGPVYTGSSIVRQLFETHSDHPVITQKFNHQISATQVRATIVAKPSVPNASGAATSEAPATTTEPESAAPETATWQKLVPPAVAKLLEGWGVEERLRNI